MVAIINTYNKIRSFIINNGRCYIGTFLYRRYINEEDRNVIRMIHESNFYPLKARLITFDTLKEAESYAKYFCQRSEDLCVDQICPKIYYEKDTEIKPYYKNQYENFPTINFKEAKKWSQ